MEDIVYKEDLVTLDTKVRIFSASIDGETEPQRVIIITSLINYGHGDLFHAIYENAFGESQHQLMNVDEVNNKYRIKL